MQHAHSMRRHGARGHGGPRPEGPSSLRRAVSYIGRYRKVALLAYGALFVATAAQLAVPQFLQKLLPVRSSRCRPPFRRWPPKSWASR
jgi:hypothetical protein